MMANLFVKGGLWSFEGDPIPLERSRIDGTIQNFVAHLNLTMSYTLNNSFKEPLDCVFKFPMHDLGTVTGFEACVGGKKFTLVKGKLFKKSEVEQSMKEAQLGPWETEELLDLNATDLFLCRVGRLIPGSTVRVKISFITELMLVAEQLALVLPPAIVPKAYAHEKKYPPSPDFQLQVSLLITLVSVIIYFWIG